MSDSDTSEIEKIEVMSNEEVRYQRSEFASVIFHNVADTYPIDAHVECSYSLTEDIFPSSRDWVGIYKVGWMSPRDYIYYEWAPVPKNYVQGKEAEATILFQAHTLPNDDGEFYQFCYVSSAGQIRGASTPFQFKKPSAGDFIEVEDEDTDMLIIRSRTLYLQENLQKKEDENRELVKYRDTMSKEVTGLADKITDLQKKLDKSEKERKDVQKLLESNQNKLDEMLSEANDMTLVHDELRSKMDDKNKEKLTLKEKISRLQDSMGSLQVKMKVLQSEKDELEGQNRTLTEEMDLYKNHLSKSETSVSSYVHEIDNLTGKLEQSGKLVTEFTGKMERHEVDLSRCREEIVTLQAALHQEKTRVEHQLHVSMSEKENVLTMTEKLRNVEDKLATEESTKDLMRKEIATFSDAQKKMSLDLEESKSECHRMKKQICRMEEDFSQENTLLKSENMAIHSDLQKVLKEKEVIQAKLCTLQDELTKLHESNDGAEGPMFALKQANMGLQDRLTNLNERYSKMLDDKKQGRMRERELNREITDLKERIHMCSEEYKQIYKENRKLQKKIDKMLGHRRWRDSKSESEKTTVAVEKLQTSSERSTPARSSSGSVSGSPLITSVAELQAELSVQKAKKDRYKQQYRDEKERLETLRQHYHEDLQAKEDEIQRLLKLVSTRDTVVDTGERDQKVRLLLEKHQEEKQKLFKHLDEKQKMIDELNQKLRDQKLECETPKPAKRSNIPRKYETDSAASPLKYEACHSSSPELIYGNPYKEESRKLTLAEQAAMCAPQPFPYPVEVISPPEGQHMSRCDDQEEVFVDASPCLPKPLEPEQTTEARMAAVKASITQPGTADELDGHCYGMPVNRTGILPSAPPPYPYSQQSDGDDIVVKVNSGRWLINSNGESRRCPRCPETFPAEIREEDFMEHVLSHMGRICPVCKMQVDDSMETKDFEYHVHCCIGTENENN